MAVEDDSDIQESGDYPQVFEEFSFEDERSYGIAETVIDHTMDQYEGEHSSDAVTTYLNDVFRMLGADPEIRVSEASETAEGTLMATQAEVPYELDVNPDYSEKFVIFEDTGQSEGGVNQGKLLGFFDVDGVE